MSWFKNIAEAISTIFEGLAITASHILRRPITVQYPDKTPLPLKEMMAPRYRGFLDVDMKICGACSLCVSACPIQCIDVEIIKQQQEGSPVPTRLISKFNIDIGKCMFCGLCVEACPSGTIRFTKEFERATPDLNDLMFKFVKGKPVVPYKKWCP